MAPRPDVSEERRKQILDAAVKVFAQHGFYKARMDDIAREAGLSKGALYWYFESKDDIIMVLMEHTFGGEMEMVAALLDASGPASERLLRLVDHFVSVAQTDFLELMPIVYEYYATAVRREEVLEYIRAYFGGYREILAGFVHQGIEQGEFRKDADADGFAVALASLVEGAMFLWFVDPEVVNLERLSEVAVRPLLESLKIEA